MPARPLPPPPIRQKMIQTNGELNLAWSKWYQEQHQLSTRFSGELFVAARASFIGRATNGAATLSNAYNVASINRTSQGVYQGSLTQRTAYGHPLLTNAVGMIQHRIGPGTNSDAYACTFAIVDDVTFIVSVYEIIQGGGTSLDRQLYDPVTVGDTVAFVALTTLTNELPPP